LLEFLAAKIMNNYLVHSIMREISVSKVTHE